MRRAAGSGWRCPPQRPAIACTAAPHPRRRQPSRRGVRCTNGDRAAAAAGSPAALTPRAGRRGRQTTTSGSHGCDGTPAANSLRASPPSSQAVPLAAASGRLRAARNDGLMRLTAAPQASSGSSGEPAAPCGPDGGCSHRARQLLGGDVGGVGLGVLSHHPHALHGDGGGQHGVAAVMRAGGCNGARQRPPCAPCSSSEARRSTRTVPGGCSRPAAPSARRTAASGSPRRKMRSGARRLRRGPAGGRGGRSADQSC